MIEERRTGLERVSHRRPVDLHQDIVDEPRFDVNVHALIDDVATLDLGEEGFDAGERIRGDSRMKIRSHDLSDLVRIEYRSPSDMGTLRFGGKALKEMPELVVEADPIEFDRPEAVDCVLGERNQSMGESGALGAQSVGQIGRVTSQDFIGTIPRQAYRYLLPCKTSKADRKLIYSNSRWK